MAGDFECAAGDTGADVDQPSQLEINIAKTAALTAGWYLVDPETLEPILEDDRPMPCTLENARELYSLPLTTTLNIFMYLTSVFI